MRKTLVQVLVVFSLVTAIAGHWTILQSVAWVNMAISYSQDAPLVEALEKTFNGENPCQLCKAVREGQQSEREQPSLKAETKLDFWLPDLLALLYLPPLAALSSEPKVTHPQHGDSPPTPPPRLV